MHIRRDNDIRPPAPVVPRPRQHFGDDCQLGIGFCRQLSINGKKAGVGTSASVTMVRCVSNRARGLPHR